MVFDAIVRDLGHDDAIFCNLEISDPQHGDVEIDLAIFIKNRGIVVVEIKGGHISFDGQDWHQQGAKSGRIIYGSIQRQQVDLCSCTLINCQCFALSCLL